MAVERQFLVHLSWNRTIIGLSKPIWEAIGVGQISRLDQKVMYLEGGSKISDLHDWMDDTATH